MDLQERKNLLYEVINNIINENDKILLYKSFFEDDDLIYIQNIILIQNKIIQEYKDLVVKATVKIDSFMDNIVIK